MVGDLRGVRASNGAIHAWDDDADLAIVGFGAAGASAAIEAAQRGAKVLVADRFRGGGATALSAGVVYLGGGTQLQKDSGWEDSPEQMFDYLKLEVEDAVSDATLRSFCEQSVENFEFLTRFGVPFPSSGKAFKTSYPPDDCTLYFSGNELCEPYASQTTAAPRGHRALGKALTGHLIFGALRRGAQAAGARVTNYTKAERLVVDDAGDVIGVELARLSRSSAVRAAQSAAEFLVNYGGGFSLAANPWLQENVLGAVEKVGVERRFVRARSVLLSAGGFVFNNEMMKRYAPDYANASMRLGTAGDDGRGIMMGHAAGGAIDWMDRCCAWRFINPPSAWIQGILVGSEGTRVCNEELYGSTIGEHLATRFGARGVLVIDSAMMETARAQMHSEKMGGFQLVFGTVNNYINHARADTLEELARKCGVRVEGLLRSVREYNEGARRGVDALQKHAENTRPIERGPFYAIYCDHDTIWFPTPTITLGGLRVDGVSQRVLRADGSVIGGLYAAGRNAAGVTSKSYVSGLSVSDGVFSGRNVGRSIPVG